MLNKEGGVSIIDTSDWPYSDSFDKRLHYEVLRNSQRALETLPEGHPQRGHHENMVELCKGRLAERGLLGVQEEAGGE